MIGLYATHLDCLLALLGVGTLLHEAFSPRQDKRRLGYMLAALVGVTLLYSFTVNALDEPLFHGMYRLDAFALYFKRLFLLATAIVLVMATEFESRLESGAAEFYALVLLCATGMMVIASVNDFILLFVALELVTVSFYVLASYLRRRSESLEAGTKYLILGALASGFNVYGISYIFGMTGTTNFDQIHAQLSAIHGSAPPALLFGVLMVLAGLGFKISSVPFQVWTPDVYQGAPTPVAAFLAVGSKSAGFALLLRVLDAGLLPLQGAWTTLLLVLAGATLLYGNLGALPQRNLKRLLGYSSIGHAGYLLMGVAAGNALGVAAVLFYLGQYAVTNLCAFLAIVAVTAVTGDDEIPGYAGLHRRSPILAAALFIAMLSLAGVPPLSGFFGKFLLFLAVIQRAATDGRYYVLAAVGAAAVVISLYFYLGVARAIYLQEPADPARSGPIRVSRPVRAVLYLGMAAIIGIGIYQRPLWEASVEAARVFKLW